VDDGAMIDRQFLRITEGLVHVRTLAGAQTAAPPLWMIHASPSSSRVLEPVMLALREAGCAQALMAPDTLGNGDSAAPAEAEPDIAYFADSIARTLDVAGHSRIDIYGTHTGARIACEFAVRHPTLVRRVILDGITEYTEDLKQLILDNYAPTVVPDDYGRQFVWAFNFVRDQWTHFPYFMRDPEHRLMNRTVPPAGQLHLAALDVLKALGTYHKPYLAAFRYEARARLKLIEAPTLFLRPRGELPALNNAVDALLPLMRDARTAATDGSDRDKAAAIAAFVMEPD
jgi:pimeloyl-ACP methyl ester carboxylesterase